MTTYTWSPRHYYTLMNKCSGKKYMGQTTQPLSNYLGSGSYWKNHCDAHGGYTRDNIVLVESIYFDKEQDARDWLDSFEQQHPDYYTEDNTDWCNLVRETTEDSPFKGNMKDIFRKHGNPFKGGSIQKKAWDDGKYDKRDHSEAARKSWINRDKKVLTENLKLAYNKWKEENPETFLANQRKAAEAAAQVLRKRITYNGETYMGWNDLKSRTGLSKYKFMKYNMGAVE